MPARVGRQRPLRPMPRALQPPRDKRAASSWLDSTTMNLITITIDIILGVSSVLEAGIGAWFRHGFPADC
jgi:hypothetical protein